MASLKDRLVDYLRRHPGWMASGDLQRLVALKTTYTPRTVVRRLEELAESGKLEVEYRKRNHAWYRFKEFVSIKMQIPPTTISLFKKQHENKEPNKETTE